MDVTEKYVEVAIALPVFGTFTYRAPKIIADKSETGKRVLVPFGQRSVTGYIINSSEVCPDSADVKDIIDVLDEDSIFLEEQTELFKWVGDYYLSPLGEVIKTALPGGINLYDHEVLNISPKGIDELLGGGLKNDEKRFLESLGKGEVSAKNFIIDGQKVSQSLIRSIKKKGLIEARRIIKGASAKKKTERFVSPVLPEKQLEKLTEKRRQVVEMVRATGEISVKKLKTYIPKASNYLKYLSENGYLELLEKSVYRDPFGESIDPDTPPELNREQEAVVNKISNELGTNFSTYLLFGVTGSGKTEVYMRIAGNAIKQGMTALVLVPEIALISQTERRFRARFGENIAVLHSGLSTGERYDQWRRILNKEANVVIGARSSIFAPLENIGVIIVDEEHDASYKQDSGLRYNARDLAVVRAKQCGCVTVLGSATPSLQTNYNADTDKFKKVYLTKRINENPLPEIRVVDLKKHKDQTGIRRFITTELQEEIRAVLERKEQVILFLNRRGYATSPVCGDCGESFKCVDCDVSLTLHQNINAYKCHFCGFSMAQTSSCRHCGSSKVKLLGLGTEKVETSVKALFPEANVARLDQDTTSRKGSLLKILKGLKDGEIDILVGTQMVAKGHDFPNVTLVGIVCADLSLSFPDFRSCERTFQLLAQVAGRAGRGDKTGRVVMQTYNPEHFSIVSAKNQDFQEFYNSEIEFRKSLQYPPFSRMIQLQISGKDLKRTKEHANNLGDECLSLKETNPLYGDSFEILGPIESPLFRLAGNYRWQIIFKSRSVNSLHAFVRALMNNNKGKLGTNEVRVSVDVDPFFMM